MARIFSVGFEVSSGALLDNYPSSGSNLREGASYGRMGGRAYVVPRPGGTSYYVQAGSPTGLTFVTQYERFYLRIRRMPTTGPCRLWSNWATTVNQSLLLNIKTDGTLELFNTTRSLGVTGVLTLDQWYRIEIKAVCNTALLVAGDPPFEDNSSATLKIDGTTILDVSPLNNGVSLIGLAFRNCQIYRSFLGAETLSTDPEYDVDHWVADSSGYPGVGRVTALRVVGQGTYAEWTGDWRRLSNLPGDGVAGPAGMTVNTTTASARTSYTLEPFSEKKITGTIHAVSIGAMVRTTGAPDLLLRVNGADTYETLPAGVGVFRLSYRSAPGIALTDTVEIGCRKDAAGGTHYIGHMCLLVDHGSADPAASTETTIRVAEGTYVGNGVGQHIAVAFEPEFLLIRAVGAVGVGLIWHKGMGERGAYPSDPLGNSIPTDSPRLALVNGSGFDVGVDAQTNTVAVTYWFLAIRDPASRMMVCGSCMPAAVDNYNVALPVPTFEPHGLIVVEQFHSGSGDVYFRGPAHIGDLATALHTSPGAPVANAIQSIGVGTFQLGTTLTTAPAQRSYWGFKTGAFVTNRLMALTSYIGTGIGAGLSRVITLNFGGLTPVFCLIVAHNAGTQRYFKMAGNVGTASQQWVTGSVTADNAIKALGADSVTIGNLLDGLGDTFTVLAFAAESDVTTLPEEEFPAGAEGETVPLSWVELALERTDTGTDYFVWSKIDLPDPASYYFGYKQGRVLKWGQIIRALSDDRGQYEASRFSWTVIDTDRLVRGLMNVEATRYIFNRQVAIRMISDAYRRLLGTPRLIARGVIRDYKPVSPFLFEFTADDFLTSKFAKTNIDKQIPQRKVNRASFPNCPKDNVGLPVPIIYGELSDQASTTGSPLTKPVVTWAIIGAGGTAVRHYVVTALDNRGDQDGNWSKGGDHSGETDGDLVVVTGAPDDNQMGAANYIELTWPAVSGAVFYRVYGRYPDFPISNLDQSDIDGSGNGYYHDGERNGVDEIDVLKTDWHPPPENNTGGVDTGRGVVPVIPVGKRTIGAVVWQEFLVCGHAVKAIRGWYQGGTRIPDSTEGTEFLIPGFAGWTAAIGAPMYRDFNGRRYTVVYAKGTKGDKAASNEDPLVLNVAGVENIGDGSGTLLTDLLDQYYHALTNWLLGNYLTGAWLPVPFYSPLDTAVPKIDAASFAKAKATGQRRVAGGYLGAWMLGPDGQLSLRDVVARLNISADVRSGFNRHSQFMITMLDELDNLPTTSRTYTQIQEIIRESFTIQDVIERLENVIPYSYARRYSEGGEWEVTDDMTDNNSITFYKETRKAQQVDVWAVRDEYVALDVIARRLLRSKDPPRIVVFSTSLTGLSTELGDIIRVHHIEGIGSSGWTDHPLQVQRHYTDPDALKVILEAEDMDRIFSGGFILGNETTLAASWAAAGTLDRRYGYLGNETLGVFSDGALIKRLR